jgi:hypothetical protein
MSEPVEKAKSRPPRGTTEGHPRVLTSNVLSGSTTWVIGSNSSKRNRPLRLSSGLVPPTVCGTTFSRPVYDDAE